MAAFIAALILSVRDCSLIAVVGVVSGGSVRSVEANALAVFPGKLLEVTLHRGGRGALADGGGLLIVLALAHFGENAGFLTGALETAQGDVKRLVILDLDVGH
jgi:hypothetical protein